MTTTNYKGTYRNGLSTKYWRPTVEQATEHNIALLEGRKEWTQTDIITRLEPVNKQSVYLAWNGSRRQFEPMYREF